MSLKCQRYNAPRESAIAIRLISVNCITISSHLISWNIEEVTIYFRVGYGMMFIQQGNVQYSARIVREDFSNTFLPWDRRTRCKILKQCAKTAATKKFNTLLKASAAFSVFEPETHLRRTILRDRLTKKARCQRGREAHSERDINLKFR